MTQTEIARRLAKLVKAPFVKVELTKYTEAGFQGAKIDSIIKGLCNRRRVVPCFAAVNCCFVLYGLACQELVENAISLETAKRRAAVNPRARARAERELIDALISGRARLVSKLAPPSAAAVPENANASTAPATEPAAPESAPAAAPAPVASQPSAPAQPSAPEPAPAPEAADQKPTDTEAPTSAAPPSASASASSDAAPSASAATDSAATASATASASATAAPASSPADATAAAAVAADADAAAVLEMTHSLEELAARRAELEGELRALMRGGAGMQSATALALENARANAEGAAPASAAGEGSAATDGSAAASAAPDSAAAAAEDEPRRLTYEERMGRMMEIGKQIMDINEAQKRRAEAAESVQDAETVFTELSKMPDEDEEEAPAAGERRSATASADGSHSLPHLLVAFDGPKQAAAAVGLELEAIEKHVAV
jgi:hypothetical protein